MKRPDFGNRRKAGGLEKAANHHAQNKQKLIDKSNHEFQKSLEPLEKEIANLKRYREENRINVPSVERRARENKSWAWLFAPFGAITSVCLLYLLIMQVWIAIPYLIMSLASLYLGVRRLPRAVKYDKERILQDSELVKSVNEALSQIEKHKKKLEKEQQDKIKAIKKS